MSLFGLIARPVVEGGAVDEADEEDEVLDAEEEVEEEADEEEEVGGFPELSCLIRSAARSACSSVLMINNCLKGQNSPDRRGPTSNETIPGKARYFHLPLSIH